jgi:hypothetical protein
MEGLRKADDHHCGMVGGGGLGIVLALAKGEETHSMRERAVKSFMAILSVTLLTSAFLPLSTPNPSRSLMLLGAGLVCLANLTRRHYADED